MNVGFTGPFGDSNFGDYAMLVNDIYDINLKDITIFSYNSNLIKSIKERYLKAYNVLICDVKVELPSNETKQKNLYVVEYNEYPYTPIEILKKLKNYDEVYEIIKNIEVLVVVGGGYFNYLWNAIHRQYKLFSILIPILIACQQNKKIVFMGNSYGPFESNYELFGCFFEYLKNCTIASRDDIYSKKNLRMLGFNKKITSIPDDIYFINKKIANEAFTKINLPNKYILLEVYCSIQELEDISGELKKFVENSKKRYNLDIVFLPLDLNYGGEKQGAIIKNMSPEVWVYDIRKEGLLPINIALNIVKNAELVLCQRYHLFLLAIANNIPAVSILKDVCGDKRYYYSKSYGMLKKAFDNQSFNELYFFVQNFYEGLKYCYEKFYDIVENQMKYFNQYKFKQEKFLFNQRNEYIKEHILSNYNNTEENINEENYD